MRRSQAARVISLRLLLVAVLTAMALVPLGIFWVWSSANAFQRQLDDVSDRHLLIARNLGAALSRYHRDVTAAFDILSRNAVAGQSIESAVRLLDNLSFRHVCLAQATTGQVVASLGPPSAPCPDTVPPQRLAEFLSHSPGPETVKTGVLPGPKGQPTIFLLRRDGDLLTIGALNTDYFEELGKAISFGHLGHAAIVDQYGTVLSHPRPDWVAAMRNIAKVDPVARMMAGERGISQFFSPALKADMIAGFTAVDGTGWGVMIPQPVRELRAAAAASNQSALLVLAAGTLAAVVLGLLFASRLTGPLQSVTTAARQMAGGDRQARAIDRAWHFVPRELLELHNTFNVMADAVEHAEKEERTARQKADAANMTKSNFLANVSHELRTPLNAIIGFSDVIAAQTFGKVQPSRYGEYAKDILDSARHLLRMINDLLDISRIEIGEIDFNETAVDVGEMLQATRKMLQHAATDKRITLSVQVEANASICVDAERLSQILVNLAGNAIRFTPAGRGVRLLATARRDGAIELAVSDDGPGISQADLERVMDPFQRGGEAITRDTDGVGLGLAIVNNLVSALGLEFELKSELGTGTTAILRIPHERILDPVAAPQIAAAG